MSATVGGLEQGTGLENRKLAITITAFVILISSFVYRIGIYDTNGNVLRLQSQSVKLQTSVNDTESLSLTDYDVNNTSNSASFEVVFEGTSDFITKLRMKHQQKIDNPPQHCVMNINTIAAAQQSNNKPGERIRGQTCGSLKALVDNELNGTESCLTLRQQESVCCPSSTDSQCQFCEGGIIDLDFVPPDTGGNACRAVKVMAAKISNESTSCTIIQQQERACCPEELSPVNSSMSEFRPLQTSHLSSNHCTFCEDAVMDPDIELDSVRIYNRAIKYDWIARNLPAAASRYSTSENDSCQFTAMEFLPTRQTLNAALSRRTFLTPYFTAEQCKRFTFPATTDARADDCSDQFFKGTLFRPLTSFDDCIEQSRLNITISTVANAPSPLLRTFDDSLGGLLPPPPNLLYATNVIISKEIHASDELYSNTCSMAGQIDSKKRLNSLFPPSMHSGKFANLTLLDRREKIIEVCTESQDICDFPTYDFVIDMYNSWSGWVYHFIIETFPRIIPFLDGLLADDEMPSFAIRWGVPLKPWHRSIIEMLGLRSHPKVTNLGSETVFAKQVICPSNWFGMSPWLNYWNIMSARSYVENRLGAPDMETHSRMKTLVVIVRDASRRNDANVFSSLFLEQLSEALKATHNVTTFRSSDEVLMSCFECQVRVFQTADVIIGSHGAGLAHLMFAKKEATVVERVDPGRHSDIFSKLSFMTGLKHFPINKDATWEEYRDIIEYSEK